MEQGEGPNAHDAAGPPAPPPPPAPAPPAPPTMLGPEVCPNPRCRAQQLVRDRGYCLACGKRYEEGAMAAAAAIQHGAAQGPHEPLTRATYGRALGGGCLVYFVVALILTVAPLFPPLVSSLGALVLGTIAGVRVARLGRGIDYLLVGGGIFVLAFAVGLAIAVFFLGIYRGDPIR